MNKFIYYPLFILFLITIFTQLINIGNTSFGYEGSQEQGISGTQTLNETENTLEVAGGSLSLDYNLTVGIVAIIVSAIVLGLIGINVLGSGLPDFSVKIIWNGIIFYGLWAIFSVTGYNFFASIPVIGVVLWVALTLVYGLGVFGRMGGSND